jgi:hypothetical protein
MFDWIATDPVAYPLLKVLHIVGIALYLLDHRPACVCQ